MAVKVGLKFIEIWGESMEDEIVAYEKEELHKGQIVFYGPSYFTRWSARFGEKPMRECLLGASGAECVVNRGFGSSCSEHQLYYYPRMIRPLEPKVLVYESHGNAGAFGYSLEERWELAQRVIAYAKTDFPGIQVYLLGPSLSRKETEESIAEKKQYAEMLKAFVAEDPDCHYIEIRDRLLAAGKDLFIEDGVHYNKEGYELYAEIFREALADELAKF